MGRVSEGWKIAKATGINLLPVLAKFRMPSYEWKQ
jgi:hypothetical protein